MPGPAWVTGMLLSNGLLAVSLVLWHTGSLYLSATPKFYTKVLHQTLNPTAELWCKTFSRIKVDLVQLKL